LCSSSRVRWIATKRGELCFGRNHACFSKHKLGATRVGLLVAAVGCRPQVWEETTQGEARGITKGPGVAAPPWHLLLRFRSPRGRCRLPPRTPMHAPTHTPAHVNPWAPTPRAWVLRWAAQGRTWRRRGSATRPPSQQGIAPVRTDAPSGPLRPAPLLPLAPRAPRLRPSRRGGPLAPRAWFCHSFWAKCPVSQST
jgi:hypothetical protein